ncbi:nitrite reductase/ring-hydroxylating ferredoxin subunit [Streptomyces sp. Ag109_O5-1]|uniref:Rieske (2Fe-2S) protein n=1 Tax=Streptomyces sp. Ag109_O5-1 TaxID=1938851 RepID=UPI000F939ED8|nr:Rieske 2Fe-2S domain-containing protein [Streptomyces sp. Ag109_O5-1]RPE38596.1 nitrite reductase/ring-hydroxylating ferredoxin subunit [Streptomyces sp. Ag109_O5-1]
MISRRLDLSELPVDGIRPVDGRTCVSRTAAGVFAFARRCPHADADLANGYVTDGWLRCAWHNLPFELSSGLGPCTSVPRLWTRRLTMVAPEIYELTTEGDAQP